MELASLENIARRYLASWNAGDVSGLLRIMHPQASYRDVFWGETCSGRDLPKYLRSSFEDERFWYRSDGDFVVTPSGLVIRYLAFDRDDHEGIAPLFNGAEVLTITDGLIMSVSDYYCDPDPIQLLEIANLAEEQHGRWNVAPLGLSARVSGHIRRQLAELSVKSRVYLDPSLTVTRLADHIDCSVMHLFHVLEVEKGTTFLKFVDECRVRHATTLLADTRGGEISIEEITQQSGFASVEEFNAAFLSTFGVSAAEYAQRFRL